jgi:hypothetical protein
LPKIEKRKPPPAKKKLAKTIKKLEASGKLTELGKRNLEKLKQSLIVKRVENPRDAVSLAKDIAAAEASA